MLTFGMNQILLTFTTAAPAVYVIYIRLQSLILIPVWGLKNTVVSIISYNYGAKNKEKILKTIRYASLQLFVSRLQDYASFRQFQHYYYHYSMLRGSVRYWNDSIKNCKYIISFCRNYSFIWCFFPSLRIFNKDIAHIDCSILFNVINRIFFI